jgi:hypothetical protein
MRKVTLSVVSAFLAGNKLTVSNTSTDGAALYLHGNKIAEKKEGDIYITNCGWFSNTTKERLNAIPNVSIQQKAGEWYLNGIKWDGKLVKVS